MPKKVFELAKELDIKPLDLVEKLKAEGFSVRNHMSVLQDDEVAKFENLFNESKAATEPKVTKKKTKKKKVAKKKVAKKKVNKIATVKTSEELAEQVKEEEKAKKSKSVASGKTTVVRKKTTVRRTKKEVEESKIEPEVQMKTSLEVIHRPEVEKEKEPEVEQKAKESIEEKDYLEKDKQHKFTPVFIPEKSEQSKNSEGESSQKSENASGGSDYSDGEAGAAKGGSKKRLGDLAAFMSKPKAAGKARDLTQIRADEELKSYITGNITGNVFTQAGKKKIYNGPSKKTKITQVKDSKRVIFVHDGITALELAKKLKVRYQELRDKVLEINLLVKQEDYLGIQLASEIASLYDYKVENKAFDEEKVLETKDNNEDKDLEPRDPIITIMGHVDHGKTTLIDYIRSAKVASGEAGGITQHIGAYSVKVKDNKLTFLDTPGHAAFGAMRQRGANVTDIVVLVVAADDGVMPQTKESVKFCQEAGVPIIIAVNKMDKEDANPDRVKQELMEFELTPEEWGGQTQYCPISALKGDGIDELLEAINLQSEIMELKANPKGKASGIVIESKMETGRGSVATLLIQQGTLKKGDYIVVGETYGRCRSLMDYSGKLLKSAGPSTPVEILGLNNVPSPGDDLNVVKNEREAKKIVDNRVLERKSLENTNTKPMVRLEDFANANGDGGPKVLKVIIRSDVQGSYEAIKNSIESLGNEEVSVQVIGGGVGAITDSDINIAASAEGMVFGFNMRPTTSAQKLSSQLGVEIRTYTIIYEIINDVTLALEGMLDPDKVEVYIGRAEVRDTFSIPKIGTIAGSAVIDGKIAKGCNIRLLREGKIVFDGKLSSLKRFKDDAKEVVNGYECGISLEDFNDVKVQDIFEAYMIEEKKRTLDNNQVN